MKLNLSEPAKRSMQRIHHRLAYQHARWITTQPIKDRFWFRACRKIRRAFRWFLIYVRAIFSRAGEWLQKHRAIATVLYVAVGAVAMLVLAAVVIGAIGLVLVVPSEALQWIDGRPLQGSGEIAAVALTRLTIVVSFAASFLWCILPGSDRNVLLRSSSHNQRVRWFSFLRKPPKSQAVSIRYVLPIIVIVTTLAVVSIGGIFARLSHPFVAVVCGIVFFIATAWMVHRVGLRMMRKRSAVIWHLSTYEWLANGLAMMGLLSLILLASSEIVSVSEHLRWIGPIGFALANLQAVATGNYLALLPVLAVCMLVVAIGWWAGKDIGTWANRRKLIASRQLLNRAEVKPVADRPEEFADRLVQIQSGLNQTIESRQLQSREFWMRPFWLRRRHVWYWIIAGCMLILVVVFGGVKIMMDHYDQPVVIGHDRGSPTNQLTRMFWMPFVFVLLCTEAMALFDKAVSVPVRFLERPLSSWRYLWRVHREGIARLPIQLALSLPFSVLLFLGEPVGRNGELSTFTGWIGMLVASIALLLALRSLFASFHIMKSIYPIINRWIAEGLQAGLAILGFATFMMYIVGSGVVAAAEIRLATYQLIALGLNLFILLVFTAFALLRRRLENAGTVHNA